MIRKRFTAPITCSLYILLFDIFLLFDFSVADKLLFLLLFFGNSELLCIFKMQVYPVSVITFIVLRIVNAESLNSLKL